MNMEEAESKGGEEVRENIYMVRHKTHNYILLRSTSNKSRAEQRELAEQPTGNLVLGVYGQTAGLSKP
jgi:hypothetical protein